MVGNVNFNSILLAYITVFATLVVGVLLMNYLRRSRYVESQQRESVDFKRRIRTESIDGEPEPTLIPTDAHVLTFSFELGPERPVDELAAELNQSLRLVMQLALAHDIQTSQVHVLRLSYKNPLDIVLLVWAANFLVSGFVGTAVLLSSSINESRRDSAGATTDRARSQMEAAAYNAIKSGIVGGVALTEDQMRNIAFASQTMRAFEYQPPQQDRGRELEGPRG